MNTIRSILDAAAEDIPDKRLFVFPENRWRAAENLTYGVMIFGKNLLCIASSLHSQSSLQ